MRWGQEQADANNNLFLVTTIEGIAESNIIAQTVEAAVVPKAGPKRNHRRMSDEGEARSIR